MRLPHRCFGLLAILLAASGLAAQDANPEIVRTVYQPKHLDAKALAEALSKQFNKVAEITSLTDSGGTNALLLSATKQTTEQVKSILDLLDRKPRLVEVQVALFEVRVKADEAKGKLTEADLKDLSGSTTRVFEKLAAFQKEGKITSLRRIELTAAENQKSRQQSGADKAMVISNTIGGGGGFGKEAPPRVSSTINYRPTGWTVTATPQISEDGTITIDLSLEDSQILTPEDGGNGGGSMNPETATTHLQSKINLASGTASVAQGVRSESRSAIVLTYVVIGTKIKDDPRLKQ